ncbi:MAG TPA: hypothetical protein DIV79_08245 [Opitutae bacterium]|nr:hypothetical protein [Opitutaceae bacterium]HCR29990.1 hypothetical protein [Opitutae bacterium]
MRSLCLLAIISVFHGLVYARTPKFEPTEKQISEHKSEVFWIARNYIVKTFNLDPVEEGRFNAVRFNSTGVWGDFRCRIKELGDHRYEVRGWISADGYEGQEIVWSVVLTYALLDPGGWKYRRLDESFDNDPKITSWRFGHYRSVPYEAEYSDDFLARSDKY